MCYEVAEFGEGLHTPHKMCVFTVTLPVPCPQLTEVVDQLNAERTAEKASLFRAEQLPDKVGGWLYLSIWQGETEERGAMLRGESTG